MSYIRLPLKSEGRLPSIPSISEEEEAPIEVTYWKCRRQVLASLIVCLGMFSVGTIFGWSSVSLVPLKNNKKIRNETSSEAAAASIYEVGAIFAGPVAGYSMFKLGRKMATFWFALILIFGWAFIPAAQWVDNVISSECLLFTGRTITGFAGAGCLVIGPVYVQEMCDEKVRSTMTSLVPLVLVFGYSFMFGFGVILPWWVLSLICLVVPVFFCVFILFVPNSPRHLLTLEGKEEEAKKAMLWLTHGFEPKEQERMYKHVKRGVEFLRKTTNRAMKRADRRQRENRLKLSLKSRPVLHPLLTGLVLIFFQQSSGINVVGSYTQDILKTGEDFVSVRAGTVIFGVLYFVATLLATVVVNRLGRKPLLLTSTVLMFIPQVCMGVFFYYLREATDKQQEQHTANDVDHIKKYFSWIPIICCNTFITAYAIGLGSVPWILATEINHPDFQEIAGTLNSLAYWSIVFISTFTFPILKKAIDYHWCFWMYSLANLFAFLFCFFFIFETKGKTQEQIMAHYKGHHYNLNGDDDEEAESKSIGSIKVIGRKKSPDSRSASAGGDHRKFSTGSDWSTDFDLLYQGMEDEDQHNA